jgi:dihydrofolate reductase
MPAVGLVVAVAENGVIGKAGGMPWHLPLDLARFKQITLDHAIVMGRRTFEAIPAPLPRRRSLVLSTVDIDGVESFRSLAAALEAAGERRVFVIGGRGVLEEAEHLADELYLTRVHANPDGDTFYYPDLSGWNLVDSKEVRDGATLCTFETYRR